MNLTTAHYQLLFEAYSISHCDPPMGMVLKPECYPAAHDLAEQGWLARRFVGGDEMSWWWTPAADQAFEFATLMNSAEGRAN